MEVREGGKGRRKNPFQIKSRALCVPPGMETSRSHLCYGQRTNETGALVLDDFMVSYSGLSS